MRALRRLAAGIRALISRRATDQALDEELQAYLDAAVADRMRLGAPREEATRAARAALGSVVSIRDATHDVGWESTLEATWQDLRYAARTLRRAPGFAAVAVITLMLGIGANTAVFSVVNGVMLRPLPAERPDELVALAAAFPNGVDPAFSFAAFQQFAEAGRAFVEPLAAARADRVAIAIDGTSETVLHKRVSGNYFTVLGIRPPLGRTLLPADDRVPLGEPVVVLSHAYWSARFGRDPAVVGRSLRLGGTLFTIVGVVPPEFVSESAGEAPDLWTPLTAVASPAWVWSGHSTTWLRILARRAPGVSLAAAQAGLEPVYDRIRNDIAAGMNRAEFRDVVRASRLQVTAAPAGSPRVRDAFAKPLQVLMGVVALVLLIACANVAILVLARGAGRQREIAICLAIGSGRGRLVRRLLAEAVLLAALGAAGGMLLALWATSALTQLAARTALSLSLDLTPDLRVLAFITAITACAVLLFGALPALRASRIDPQRGMRTDSAHASAVRIPFGRALVIGQIAIAAVLLVVAGLFVRSLSRLHEVDTGFDPDGVLLVQLTPPTADPPVGADERRTLYRQLLARAESVPGVVAASLSFTGLFNEGTWGNTITVEGYDSPAAAPPRTFANAVSHGYFDVVGLTIRRGRPFLAADDEASPRVAVVNDVFARRFFGTADPIGKHVGLGAPARDMMEIVGVVEDAKYVELREEDRPMLYVPFTQYDANLRTLEVRADTPPAAVAPALRRQLSTVDPRIAVLAITEFADQIESSIAADRLVARLSAGFGLLALTLAAVGLYGLIACLTAQRTTEIGIRLALGGDSRHVHWLVIRNVIVMAIAGAGIGLPIGLGAARLMDDLLFRVGPADPFVVVSSLAALLTAAALASYVPVRRAARIDPVVALRSE